MRRSVVSAYRLGVSWPTHDVMSIGADPYGTPDGGSQVPGAGLHPEPLWVVASQIAAGMLANPARSHYSVKDALWLFDEVVSELEGYTRLRDGSGMAPGRPAAPAEADAATGTPPSAGPVVPTAHEVPRGHLAPVSPAQADGSSSSVQPVPSPARRPSLHMNGLDLPQLPSSEQLRELGIARPEQGPGGMPGQQAA